MTWTVLVVDDMEDVRFPRVMALEDQGFHVVEAADGQEALELVLAGGIDAMLTDNDMGLMNGDELIRQVRARGYTDMPIALSSGAYNYDLSGDCKVSYLPKPCRLSQVVAWAEQAAA